MQLASNANCPHPCRRSIPTKSRKEIVNSSRHLPQQVVTGAHPEVEARTQPEGTATSDGSVQRTSCATGFGLPKAATCLTVRSAQPRFWKCWMAFRNTTTHGRRVQARFRLSNVTPMHFGRWSVLHLHLKGQWCTHCHGWRHGFDGLITRALAGDGS